MKSNGNILLGEYCERSMVVVAARTGGEVVEVVSCAPDAVLRWWKIPIMADSCLFL